MIRLVVTVFILGVLNVSTGSASIGGVSGGGGNVIAPMPPDQTGDPEMVEDIVKDSVGALEVYLRTVREELAQMSPAEDRHQLFGALFARPQNVFFVMKQVRPAVQESKPCFDRERKPVDGSVANLHEGRFCISAFSIAQKVHRHEIPAQSTALLMHEYSELVGMSEDEAIRLQRHVLEDFKSF